jgi:hypothetical protein
MCVEADNLEFILDVQSIFNVITASGNSLSHKYIGNDLSVEQSLAIKYDWEIHKGHLEVFDEYGIRYIFY